MTTRLMPKLAAATAAGVAMYVATIGLPPLSGCGGLAGATPSPSCGGDLRECLRLSADIRQTTFGGRYVTAEDVARCVEIFNNCIHGGANSGGNQVPPGSRPPQGGSSATPPTATSTPKGTQGTASAGTPVPPTATSKSGSGNQALPQHFGITSSGVTSDCRVSGESITCTESWNAVGEGVESDTSTVTGTLNGMTMTGTRNMRRIGHVPSDPSCGYTEEHSMPVTYRFGSGGTVAMSSGAGQWEITHTGSCAYLSPETGTSASGDANGTWSAIG